MTRFYVGILTGILGLASGGWLVLAPFAFGYQPEGAAWVDATKVEFFTGLGLLVVGLATAVAYATGLVGALRAEGTLAPRTARRRGAGRFESAGEPGDLQEVVGRLAAALEADLEARSDERADHRSRVASTHQGRAS